MRLKQGKDFFSMRNFFSLNTTASYLIDLTLCMQRKEVEFRELYFRYFIVIFQNQDTGFGALKVNPGKINIVLVGLFNLKFFSGLFGFVVGRSRYRGGKKIS